MILIGQKTKPVAHSACVDQTENSYPDIIQEILIAVMESMKRRIQLSTKYWETPCIHIFRSPLSPPLNFILKQSFN